MNEAVRNVLNNNKWTLATYDDEPNAVPVFFKKVTDDGRLLAANVFMETTIKNVAANGRIAVSAYDESSMEGYQIKGHAAYVTEGAEFEAMAEMVKTASKGALACRGLLVISPERTIVTTPGPANKEEL